MSGKRDYTASAEGEMGPGWYDVWELAWKLTEQFKEKVCFDLQPQNPSNGRWGVRIVAWIEHMPHIKGYGSYGRAFPGNGQKTMAAAMWHALFHLDEELSRSWLAQMNEDSLPF